MYITRENLLSICSLTWSLVLADCNSSPYRILNSSLSALFINTECKDIKKTEIMQERDRNFIQEVKKM